ncbi:helix-turn-helix domain-containing protein [Formosa maritima]|uniref:Helix-turn-helix transcriptional regulator n=1 Tax=Formosa maritima TaxID=2592046 RepID=A0A5D0GL85_9FLAO|nr:helix-turn-helix transcriptional regulator [Formosa maritima]TYA58262.1 helix-turn-helix transcriptional regulator [Formosa maritima]
MKKYTSIGALLIDFRKYTIMSQAELAAKFDVDIRTIIRWEKNETLLKPDKEEEMVDITFIPYQVIRNLNAPVSIPVFYDFNIRKYSLSSLSKDLPDPNWIKNIHSKTNRIRTIKYDSDLNDILRCTQLQPHIPKPISKELIIKASEILSELNLIIFDTSGYYSGHCVFFPLTKRFYNKIKKRQIKEEDITIEDLIDYKKSKSPVFYAYDINSDCNENFLYIAASILEFLKKFKRKYTYAAYTSRNDTYDINKALGLNIIWEDKELQKEIKSIAPPRLYEGNFKYFLEK